MKQSLLFIVLLVLSSSSSPINARGKSNPAKSPSQSAVPAPAPGPSSDECSTIIFSMMDCLSYLTPGSNDTMPSKSCCDGIEAVVKVNPKCICAGLVSASQMGFPLNNTRALATPKTCKLSVNPPHCGMMSPTPSTPGASPVSPSAGSPKTSPSGGTPKTSPAAAKSPATSPSSEETPTSVTAPAPSASGTNMLSVPGLTIIALSVSSIVFISAFSN